MSSQPL